MPLRIVHVDTAQIPAQGPIDDEHVRSLREAWLRGALDLVVAVDDPGIVRLLDDICRNDPWPDSLVLSRRGQ